MKMDLIKLDYNSKAEYEEYIYGSADVVGLMCLKVFVKGNNQKYEQLKDEAMRLGSAFQKVNFLRDLGADFNVLDRTYFPNVEIETFTIAEKKLIEQEIEQDFKDALHGLKKLPHSSRLGVYLAYTYYRSLFKKIKRVPPKQLLVKRIRITNSHKLLLMFQSMINYKMNTI
jgi:phytoene/squalene synthetase